MGARIIDGRKIADEIQAELEKAIERMGKTPGLAIVMVGEDPASQVYTRIKKKAAEKLGIKCEHIKLPAEASEGEVIKTVERLNNDNSIHGIIVQLPLPKGLDEKKILATILPEKDVDCLHPANVGKLLQGDESLTPCTPHGIMVMLEKEGIELDGKNVTVIGRSNIVGRPVAIMAVNRSATVTICHSHTKDLAAETRKADVLIVAAGKPKLVTKDMVKPGATVIDVGVNRVGGKLCGDVDFEAVKEVAGAITPVPGGVGPMTVTMLMKNVVEAAK